MTMPSSARASFVNGIAPVVSTAALRRLLAAVEADDPALIQGATTTPAPLLILADWPVEAACALGFCGWRGEGLETVAQVEEYFATTCFKADQGLGEPAGCRWFLNWFDETPRPEMRRDLAELLREVLAGRPAEGEGVAHVA